MMFSALRAAFAGNERVTTRRGLIIGAVVIAALAAIAIGAIFQWIVGASGEGADRERPVRAGGERR